MVKKLWPILFGGLTFRGGITGAAAAAVTVDVVVRWGVLTAGEEELLARTIGQGDITGLRTFGGLVVFNDLSDLGF